MTARLAAEADELGRENHDQLSSPVAYGVALRDPRWDAVTQNGDPEG